MFWSTKSKLKRAIRAAGLKKCKSEADAERRLVEKLRKHGFDVLQQVHRDGQRADIVVCDIPIGIKYQPTTTEMDRLVGQVARYKSNWGDVVVVLVKGRCAIVSYRRRRKTTHASEPTQRGLQS